MPPGKSFDLVVIGAGTGANSVARACGGAGWKVATVDSLPYGGTCALRGCDPKKMLVGATEALDWTRRMKGRGVRATGLEIDWTDLMAFKRTFTDVMPGRVEGGLEKAGVVTLHGTAHFVSPNVVRVGDRELRARYVHIATGARPATLGIPGEDLLTTSTEFLNLESLPDRIAFVGGGFISFEFAHIARRAGASEVTILHRGERPLPAFDPDLVGLLVERTRELGIDVRFPACVDGVATHGSALRVDASTPEGSESLECDAVVHGAGRVPNLDELQLETANVEYGPRGIKVSDSMRSVSNPAVFSAGDCADTPAPNLTPVSAYEARIAFKNLLAEKDERQARYPAIPSMVFTIPPLGRVGLLEEEARQQGMNIDVHFQETGHWYSSLRVAETHSAYKVIVNKATGQIVGAHLIGPGAEEQLNLLALAMNAGLSSNQIKAAIFAYPSYASDLGSMV
jgi:glutathione reductase (NADPH)